MKNFGIGLSLGLIGAMIWYIGIGLVACEEYYESITTWQAYSMKFGGFVLMVAGPVVYWIAPLIIKLVKRGRED